MIGYTTKTFITYKLLFTYTKKSIFSLFSTFFRKTVFLFTGSYYNITVSQTKEFIMNNADRVNLGLMIDNISSMGEYNELIRQINWKLKMKRQQLEAKARAKFNRGDWVCFEQKNKGMQEGRIIKMNRINAHVTMQGSSNKFWIVPILALNKIEEEK